MGLLFVHLPNLTHITFLEGVGQEHLGLVVYEMIKNNDVNLFLLLLMFFYKSLARCQ
jgi:hypothetical protein